MHLKNFSLIENEPASREYSLSRAYDMLSVNVVMPEDKEQLALTLNGKKEIENLIEQRMSILSGSNES